MKHWTHSDDEPVVTECVELERDLGWGFHVQSRRAIDGDRARRLIGNGLIIVNRQDGSIRMCGTGLPTEYYIAKYVSMTDEDRRAPGLLL